MYRNVGEHRETNRSLATFPAIDVAAGA